MAKHNTMFRSADMCLMQLCIDNEVGRETVVALGDIGQIQFRDLNSKTTAFQRTFTQEIRNLDNIERQLRYFHAQTDKANIHLRKADLDAEYLVASSASEIDEISDRSQNLEERITSLNESYEILRKREIELSEWRWVLREAGGFFDRAQGNVDEIRQSTDDDDAPLLQDIEQNGHSNTTNENVDRSFSIMNIGFVAGVIPRYRVAAFERILWRTLRGNLYMNQSEIPEPLIDPSSNEAVHKNVFIIFAHGQEIISKIRKISESLGANLYSVDENNDLRRDQMHEVNSRMSDLGSVLENTKKTLNAELTQIAQNLASWMIIIKKEKAVYQTLNLFSYNHAKKMLIAEAWCPTNSMSLIRATLSDVNSRADHQPLCFIEEIRTNKTPPTYQKTNKFTEGFQTIINAYGTAKYQEVNPGLPTIVTFPFLFAVMFGDMGHGFLMFCAAAAMIYWEKPLKKIRDELFSMAYYGRYIMLMMGIFSMYTGFIYNDVFSKSLSIFPSAWEWKIPKGWQEGQTVEAQLKGDYRYPFGLDWMWHGTENDLLFANSYKMKLSILMGWCHMTYSLCLSYVNARHFKSSIDIWGVFIPGMIFFQAIFGYLVFTIIYKWCTDWYAIGKSPPGLLNMLIYMFLSPGTIQEPLYDGQAGIQIFLVLIAIVQVPILLFLKPFYLRWENNRARAKGYRGIGEHSRVSAIEDEDDNDSNTLDGRNSNGEDGEGMSLLKQEDDSEEHEEFEFGEVMIHQVIHTIEFCLNCVSHTASYLRLWALSLAHQQLSVVLWSMTLAIGLSGTGIVSVFMLVITFFVWFFLSIAVLVVMEGTSAMLHSLRLHWVEAMSKHFMGDGIPFEPYSFKRILEEDETAADFF
ncbi:hypothetical protein Golomagni_03725 [Golovinomyces magnicellulatus]|nr:hypothetical protein Golomagni_03725 [Golovinomyces magnicellulatus]